MHRFVKILSFLILSVISFPEVKAQNGFGSGYVIKHDFDTLTGKVKDRRGDPFARLYKKIRFKRNGVFVKKYGPSKIKGYAVGENIFESHWIQVNSILFRTEYLSQENLGKKYFLKVKENGYLTYYQWEFIDQESSIIEAIDLFKREDEDFFIRVTQGIFGLKMKTLEKYFEDCPELMEHIQNGKLKSPKEIAVFYNDWLEASK
jgi:hypothetical protein